MPFSINDAAISGLFLVAVRAEEAAKATGADTVRIPADARRINFRPDTKHFAYFNSATSELFVGMPGEGALVNESTLIEVLAHVSPSELTTIYVGSFASIYPTFSPAAEKEPIDVFVCDLGKVDLVVCDLVIPAEEAAWEKCAGTIYPSTPVGQTRYYEHDGKLYLIRDMMCGAQCQYAVKGKSTAVDWKDCRQAVEFARSSRSRSYRLTALMFALMR